MGLKSRQAFGLEHTLGFIREQHRIPVKSDAHLVRVRLRCQGRMRVHLRCGHTSAQRRTHVQYLTQARALGASLLVALNTDASARRLGKGPDRPLNPEDDRTVVMAALASTSLVTWFDEDTPYQIIDALRPDILVKGGDYDMATLAETQLVMSYGGSVQAIPFVSGYSTTALVQKIRAH